MPKTYTAQSVEPNHDYDFSVGAGGLITAMVVKAIVNYGSMGREERLDIWPLLSVAQRQAIQSAYNQIGALFNQHYLS